MIDSDAIAALGRPGMPDLVARLVGLFCDETPRLIQAIENGVKEADAEAVRIASHTLESSAAYVGAREFSKLCSRLERAARDGNLVECTILADELEPCFQATLAALDGAVPSAA